MNSVNYKRLCHQLEATVDDAVTKLTHIPGNSAAQVREMLLTALTETESEIICEEDNVIPFPTM